MESVPSETTRSVKVATEGHGSPAQRTDVNYLRVTSARCGMLRQVGFCTVTVLCVFLLYLPLAEGGVFLLLAEVPTLGRVLSPGATAIASPTLYLDALYVSLVLFFGLVLGGLLFKELAAESVTSLSLYSMLVAIIGAILVLLVYHTIFNRQHS